LSTPVIPAAMQQVSQAWKDAQEQTLVPESYVEIILNVGDPDAQADAAPSDNGHEDFSSTEHLIDETEKEQVLYATLEHNIWPLNGTARIVPNSGPYGNNGFIGNELSGNDGTYSVTPTITIQFS